MKAADLEKDPKTEEEAKATVVPEHGDESHTGGNGEETSGEKKGEDGTEGTAEKLPQGGGRRRRRSRRRRRNSRRRNSRRGGRRRRSNRRRRRRRRSSRRRR